MSERGSTSSVSELHVSELHGPTDEASQALSEAVVSFTVENLDKTLSVIIQPNSANVTCSTDSLNSKLDSAVQTTDKLNENVADSDVLPTYVQSEPLNVCTGKSQDNLHTNADKIVSGSVFKTDIQLELVSGRINDVSTDALSTTDQSIDRVQDINSDKTYDSAITSGTGRVDLSDAVGSQGTVLTSNGVMIGNSQLRQDTDR